MRKISFLLVFILCTANILTAGGGKEEATVKEDKIKIRYLVHTVTEWNDALSLQIPKFQKLYPNVEIEFISVPVAEVPMKVQAGIAGGNPPEIMGVDVKMIPQLVESGSIEPVPTWLDTKIRTEYVEAAGELGIYRGKMWAVAKEYANVSPYFNEAIWKENGVTIPTTYQEMLDAYPKLLRRTAWSTCR